MDSTSLRLQPEHINLGTTELGTNLLKLDYTYESTGNHDNNGNILSQTITVPAAGGSQGFTASQAYSYDQLNRVSQAIETLGGNQLWGQSFGYDRYGNRSIQ